MNGCAWMATSPPSASPTTRRNSSATWCSSSCRRSAAMSPPTRPAPWWRASRPRPMSTRRWPARWWRPTRPSSTTRRSSTATPRARAGSSASRLDDTDAFDALMDAARLRRIRGDARLMDVSGGTCRAGGGGQLRFASHRSVRDRYRRDAARGRRGDAGRPGGEDRAAGDPYQPDARSAATDRRGRGDRRTARAGGERTR